MSFGVFWPCCSGRTPCFVTGIFYQELIVTPPVNLSQIFSFSKSIKERFCVLPMELVRLLFS